VIFLFGERVKRDSRSLGARHCPVCRGEKNFSHVLESNYFHAFGLRLLPLEKIADYQQCDYCESAFAYAPEVPVLPSQVSAVQTVIAYVLVGYGHQDIDLAADVASKVTSFELSREDFQKDVRALAAGRLDLFEVLKEQARSLNLRGKQQVIEAAFLATHACCEIQYEDRLRINMIANAMDTSIAFVNATIEQVRRQGCYGVRRILPTQPQV
jgi:hypothetical protein